MKKVCAYCRVSTDKDDQTNSLENQKRFFESYINRNHEWELVNIYVDEGISGTSVKRRKAFNQMIEDAENKAFDMILTKEISRFARNTLDSIYYTRKLKDLGIGVIFLNDNINTLDPDSELRLTIMSSIAQEESRKTSERVKWGQKRQMERGVVFGSNNILGYNVKDGKLYVNEKEAEIVRLIFDLYLRKGLGATLLCRELEDRGIPAPTGGNTWRIASVLRILKNEKYIGILKQKKLITMDYLSHKRIKNTNDDYIIIENNHEAIIDKETFETTQKEIKDRREKAKIDKGRYSNRYTWSGKIICGFCNDTFKRRIWNKKTYPRTVWQCQTNIKYGSKRPNKQNILVGCDNKCVHEDFLEKTLTNIISNLQFKKVNILTVVKYTVNEVLTTEATENPQPILADISKLEKQKDKLIELFYDEGITKADLKKSNEKLNKQIEALQSKLSDIEKSDNTATNLKNIYDTAENIIDNFINQTIFSGEIVKQFLNKIIIYGREKADIYININGKYHLNFIYPFR